MYSTIWVDNDVGDHFGIGVNRSTFDEDMCENDFRLPSDLDLYASNLLPCPVLYVFTKLNVSTALLFGENRRHGPDGQTDGMKRNAAPYRGRGIMGIKSIDGRVRATK